MADDSDAEFRTAAILVQAITEKLAQLEGKGTYRDQQLEDFRREMARLSAIIREEDGQRSLLSRMRESEQWQRNDETRQQERRAESTKMLEDLATLMSRLRDVERWQEGQVTQERARQGEQDKLKFEIKKWIIIGILTGAMYLLLAGLGLWILKVR